MYPGKEDPLLTRVWYRMSPEETLRALRTDVRSGLSSAEAHRRSKIRGLNELTGKRRRSIWSLFLKQIRSPMVLILIASCGISLLLGETALTAAILAIICLNAFLEIRDEYKAEKAIPALKHLSGTRVKLTRDGKVVEAWSRALVPGDVVHLAAGDLVPADCRLIACDGLRIQESALTGESEPVVKTAAASGSDEDHSSPDRTNMALMGTMVVHGRGTGAVTATGMATELGQVAGMIQIQEEEASPLQGWLFRLTEKLALAVLVLVFLLFLAGIVRGGEPGLLLLTAVSLAVAAMPEGLPAVMSTGLALGAKRMVRQGALVRRLPAVMSLGSVTVICADKTGTLTERTMTLTILDAAGRRMDLKQDLLKSGPRMAPGVKPVDLAGHPAMTLLLMGGALCNDTAVREHPDGSLSTMGDPTEGALVMAAARSGLIKSDLDREMPRIREIPFDADRRLKTTVHSLNPVNLPRYRALPEELFREVHPGAGLLLFTRGAMDSLLPRCDRILGREGVRSLEEGDRKRIRMRHDELARMGMRVLGIGYRSFSQTSGPKTDERLESSLIYVGMVGMFDPPRAEVLESVKLCQTAGIRPVMITGDHPLTAAHIARELGIGRDSRVLTGTRMETLNARELEDKVDEVDVYALVSPADKLRIVNALKARGHIVAMTGQGVNDAMALKRADVGLSMGRTGTEVAKEASDIVLEDDNFSTIVHAIREGRTIFDNIRKLVLFILASNWALILVMLAGPLLGMPLPLYPLQILWINLVSDGLPAVALALDPAGAGIMDRAPVDRGAGIMTRGMIFQIVWVGALLAVLSLGLGYRLWSGGHPGWRTLIFTTLTFGQMANALAVRTGKRSLFRVGAGSNTPLLGAVLLTCVLQLTVVYTPALQGVFRTTPPDAAHLAVCLVLSSLVFWAVQIKKRIRRSPIPEP